MYVVSDRIVFYHLRQCEGKQPSEKNVGRKLLPRKEEGISWMVGAISLESIICPKEAAEVRKVKYFLILNVV